MTMSVTLYQGSKVNGSTRMGLWSSLNEQRDYFNSLSKVTYSTGTVKLGEPLRINESINNLMSYDYGNIDYGDGFRYYFSIADMQMVTESLTDIYYIVDAYETLVMQKPFNYGRAQITRYPSRIGKPTLTYDPNVIIGYTKYKWVGIPWSFIALAWDSVQNIYKTILISSSNQKGISIYDIFDGGWYDIVKTHFSSTLPLQSDIIINALIPSPIYLVQYENPITDVTIQPLMNNRIVVRPSDFLRVYASDLTVSSDETHITVIRDMRGNDVFTIPIGYQYVISNEPASILMNVSTISVELTYSNGDNEQYFKIPCESVSWNVDNFAEYNARQRTIDIETRNMQNEKALMDGLANAVVSAGTGAIMGGIGGGAGMGAVAGGLSAVGGSIIGYAVNSFYAEREQNIIDKSYRYANDYLVNMGNFSYGEFAKDKQGIVILNYDSDVSNQNDIAVNGYPVSFPVDDFDNYITTGKIQANVEILNISNQSWREQITNRFANGVMLV